MGRKTRKRARKKKSQKQQIDKQTNNRLRKLARRLTKEASDRLIGKPINQKAFCKKCQRVYCLNFAGQDSYCEECFYGKGCAKKIQHIRLCQECSK